MQHTLQAVKQAIRRVAKRIPSDQGSALVLTGIAMAVLIGFTALAVDGGYMYFRHTKLQDVADASALAATRQLTATAGSSTQKKTAAFNAALRCVQLNGFSTDDVSGFEFDVADGDELGHITVSFPAGTAEARVDFTLTAGTFFAKAVSIHEAPLGVTATAEVTCYDGPTEIADLVPIAFFHGSYTVGTQVDMTLAPGDGVKGNYGFLNFGCACHFRDYLEDGYPGTIKMGDVVDTHPGVMHGQVKHALADRLAGCTHGCSMTPEIDIEEPCPRVVVVPMVSGFHEACGRSTVTVTGFVKIFIESYDDSTKVLSAWVLGQAGPAGFTGTDALALRSARLK